jgi:hypothetical protein
MHGDAGGEHEERQQEFGVTAQRGRIEQRAADRRDDKANHRAVLVSEPLDQHAGRQRDDEVRAEETELHQHRLHVCQRVDRLQMRDQHVVERGDQAHHEEQRGDDAHGAAVAFAGAGGADATGVARRRRRVHDRFQENSLRNDDCRSGA